MKTKHADGIEVYIGKVGRQKGKHYARLWQNGEIIAASEGYTKKARAKSWGQRLYNALADALGYEGV